MKTKSILVGLAFLLLGSQQVVAVMYINDGQEHVLDHDWDLWLWIDYESPGMGTSLEIAPGGKVGRLTAYEDSIVRLAGGAISSTFSMPDGGSLLAHDRSRIIMSGGSVHRYLDVTDNAQATIYGGGIGNRLHVSGYAQATVHNAVISRLGATNSGNVDFLGGHISQKIFAGHGATITIHGSDFVLDGTPIDFGTLTSINGGNYTNEPVRYLNGFSSNGGRITTELFIGNNAKVFLVPEPATLLLLSLGTVIVRRKLQIGRRKI